MGVLWDAGVPLTPRAVLDRLAPDPPLTYSTVMTILRRLWRKGIVERERLGRTYLYRPVRERAEQMVDRMMALLVAAGDPAAALSRFVDALDPRQRRELRRLLDRPRRR